MKLNKQWQNIFQFKLYVQHNNNRVRERLINRNLYVRLVKLKSIFLRNDNQFIIIIISDSYKTHVKKLTKIKKKE